ncbi:Heterokaryon incompatibility protein (HET) domain containing protein [Hyaloscypha variabilis]
MSEPSAYSPLTQGHEIRLLELQPGKKTEQIIISLKHAMLHSDIYEALSYEWKSEEGSETIQCGAFSISATKNLIRALRVLRHPAKSRWLWVDALCINQKDLDEKSKQIPMMRDIYSGATMVLVWLGEGSVMNEAALEVIQSLALLCLQRLKSHLHETPVPGVAQMLRERPKGSLFTSDKDIYWTSRRSDWRVKPYALPRRPELSDDAIFKFEDRKLWQKIDTMFASSYFERSWVIQEVAVGREVFIVCTEWTMPWDVFARAYEGRSLLLFHHIEEYSRLDSGLAFSAIRDARRRYRNPDVPWDLASVLTTFAYSKQKFPEDHIYAALGLVKVRSSGVLAIIPDYRKKAGEVFLETATSIINERQDLYLWGTQTLSSRRNMKSLPSWVPDWTAAPTEAATEYYSQASADLFPGFPMIYGQSLCVQGHILDKADQVLPMDGREKLDEIFSRLAGRPLGKTIYGPFGPYLGGNNGSLEDAAPMSLPIINTSKKIIHFAKLLASILTDLKQLIHALDCVVLPPHPLDNSILCLEALWSVFKPHSRVRPRPSTPLGEKLFLAFCWVDRMMLQGRWASMPLTLPKGFGMWVQAALTILHSENNAMTGQLRELCAEHMETALLQEEYISYTKEELILTKRGYLGRVPEGVVKPGHVVAILGGASIPYVLEKREDHYCLISHVYVEGIMNMKTLPKEMKLERIHIE